MNNKIKYVIKMKRIYYVIIMLAVWMLTASCAENHLGQTPTDGVAPPTLTNVEVEELPGGARITYDLPSGEPDISYVKGEYLFQGVKKTVRASAYDNYLIIEGFGSVEPIEISLYLVDHSENASAPVNKTFTPKTPPITSIYESLTMEKDWGGVLVQWDNPTGIEIGVSLFTTDSLGEFKESETRFFLMREGRYVFRGFDSLERKFGIRLIDRWNNTSPVKEQMVTPIHEKVLDRTLHKQANLPWDNTSIYNAAQPFSKIFDGLKTNACNSCAWHTAENHSASEYGFTIPVLFTIDLGFEAILNRFIIWQDMQGSGFLYGHHNPRTFEVWGTTEIPAGKPNEYWHEDWKNDWMMFGDFEIIKPSGLPAGTLSDEDRAALQAGHEFYVPKAPVRYLRFAVKSTWVGDGDNTICLNELEFHGNDRQ
jgi:hypothetical protein